MRAILSLSLTLCTAIAAAQNPNIILVIADDLGYGDLSCYGQKSFLTPNIDRLAKEGIRFTDHYAGSTVCAPSRACLMTGLDTGHVGMRGNGPFALRPDPADHTVASLLRSAGYLTALIGKSCVTGNTQTPETLTEKGFDIFFGTTDHKDGHFRFPKFVYDNQQRIELGGNALLSGPTYDVDLYTQKALSFLEKVDDRAFFMILSYPVPHATLHAPNEALQKVRPGVGKDTSYEGAHYGKVDEVKASYAAMITRMDDGVGRLIEKLGDKGLDRNTLIVFTSDNGSHNEGGYHFSMLQSNSTLRGGKRDLYEGGIRVPLIVRWPGGISQPGRVSNHISAFWDFLPTACDLAKIPKPNKIQGISYAPTLRGETQTAHDGLYWEFHELGGRRALRMGPWKLVQYGLAAGRKGKPQLYNLIDDVSEMTDLAAKHPERVTTMLKYMAQARKPDQRFSLQGLDEF